MAGSRKRRIDGIIVDISIVALAGVHCMNGAVAGSGCRTLTIALVLRCVLLL